MIIAIDPGSVKTGVAAIDDSGRLLWKKIIKTERFESEMAAVLRVQLPAVFVMGNGTHHKEIKKKMENLIDSFGGNIRVELVNERYTTEIGEQWYWRDHPRKGLRRLIPKGLQSVPVPIDDYVAWIIGCIYLGIIKEEDVGHPKV